MAIATVQKKVKNEAKGRALTENIRNLDLKISFSGRVSTKEIIFFTSQLSLMIEIGSPLNVCLSTIAGQIRNPEFKKALKDIVTDVEGGKLLSHALGKHPHIFSNVYISLVKAGENSGQLRDMLDRVVAVQEKQQRFVEMVRKALTYPAILSCVSVVVVVFLLTFVFPRFAVLFQEIEDILPMSTKLLLAMSKSLRAHWYIFIAAAGISAGAVYAFLRSRSGKRTVDRLKISLPLMAAIYIKIYLVQMMRTLGFLMSCNVPLLEALKITREGAHNLIFANFIGRISENVEEGRGMSAAFIETDFIPENARQVVKTGEETQSLPKVLLRLSDYYEGEIEDQMKRISTFIEPLLLIIMGAVVGTIVMSLILPIFKLSKIVH